MIVYGGMKRIRDVNGRRKKMNNIDIDRHILRAVYELELVRDEYKILKDNDNFETIEAIITELLLRYPEVEEELDKETWK